MEQQVKAELNQRLDQWLAEAQRTTGGRILRLLLVSYAVYKIPKICEAIVQATRRGVRVTIIVENPERVPGEETYDTLRALGPEVAERCHIYVWPLEKRQKDPTGRPGILHVKCAVADARSLSLSRANLTEYALTVNMELGVLITGGEIPLRVESHFSELISSQTFSHI